MQGSDEVEFFLLHRRPTLAGRCRRSGLPSTAVQRRIQNWRLGAQVTHADFAIFHNHHPRQICELTAGGIARVSRCIAASTSEAYMTYGHMPGLAVDRCRRAPAMLPTSRRAKFWYFPSPAIRIPFAGLGPDCCEFVILLSMTALDRVQHPAGYRLVWPTGQPSFRRSLGRSRLLLFRPTRWRKTKTSERPLDLSSKCRRPCPLFGQEGHTETTRGDPRHKPITLPRSQRRPILNRYEEAAH
jgi:hypothetical protein